MKDFFKKLGIKTKIIFGVLVGIASLLLYGFLKKKQDPKDFIEYKINKVKSEMELAQLEKDGQIKIEKIESLKKDESELRKKLSELEKLTPEERLSLEDLDEFFDKRGF